MSDNNELSIAEAAHYWQSRKAKTLEFLDKLTEPLHPHHNTLVAFITPTFSRSTQQQIGSPPAQSPFLAPVMEALNIPDQVYRREMKYLEKSVKVLTNLRASLRRLHKIVGPTDSDCT